MKHTQTKVIVILDTLAHTTEQHDTALENALTNLKFRLGATRPGYHLADGVNVSEVSNEFPVDVPGSGIGSQIN